MEKITPIKEELKQLGSGLGNFPAVNPYKVPAGYFDEFPVRMFKLVSGGSQPAGSLTEESLPAGSLPAALEGLPTPYQVPAGYFDNLPETILKKAKASSEQSSSVQSLSEQSSSEHSSSKHSSSENSSLEQSSSEKSLLKPSLTEKSGVVESVADELAELSSILSGIDKKTPFAVPDNYFKELSGNIVSGAQAVDMVNEELENLSPLMASLKPINVYAVPDEYFRDLPGIILNKVKTSEPAGTRVVKGFFSRRIIQYAAAAVITGLMITAGFFIVNRNTNQQDFVSIKGLEEKTAQASDEDILNYLSTQHVPLPDSLVNTNPEIKADAILDMLANVSDEELQQYLQLQTDTKISIN